MDTIHAILPMRTQLQGDQSHKAGMRQSEIPNAIWPDSILHCDIMCQHPESRGEWELSWNKSTVCGMWSISTSSFVAPLGYPLLHIPYLQEAFQTPIYLEWLWPSGLTDSLQFWIISYSLYCNSFLLVSFILSTGSLVSQGPILSHSPESYFPLS